MKTVLITQAHVTSTRLPNKVLKPLLGRPMLCHHVERISRAKIPDEIVVAISDLPADDPLADLCEKEGWMYYRGSDGDVIDRYYQTAKKHAAEIIVRVTSDCPIIDPDEIDRVIKVFSNHNPTVDYAYNALDQRTIPWGLDVEVFTFEALQRSWSEDNTPASREQVSQFFWDFPKLFHLLSAPIEEDHNNHRWTVDYPEDFELMVKIFDYFGHNSFSWREVLDVCANHPEFEKLNAHLSHG